MKVVVDIDREGRVKYADGYAICSPRKNMHTCLHGNAFMKGQQMLQQLF